MKALLAISTFVFLASCDGGGVIDQTVRSGVRQSAVEACVAWVPESSVTLAAGIDGRRVCACAVDRMLTAKSMSDLAELRPDSPEGRAAIAQCITQIQSSAG